jgi:hypothetical protein
MKAIVLLSKVYFPQHPKAGQETHFRGKIPHGIGCPDCSMEKERDGISCYYCKRGGLEKKIHTCRANFEYWAKKIARLKEKGGVLSVRQWSKKPYRSPQETIIDIPSEIVGVQKLIIEYGKQKIITRVDNRIIHLPRLAKNDGLDTYDFIDWFKPVFEKGKKESLDFAIIHFTNFRY